MGKFGRAAPWALFSFFAWSSSAAAGPRETLRSIAFHPADSATYAAVFNEAGGGLLITHDGGKSFQLACMSYVTGERTIDSLLPVVSYTADGHLVVATFDGLFRDDGHGCGFTRASELGDDYVAGITVDPAQPGTLYALTSSGGKQNGIFRSLDQGTTWSLFGQLEDAYFRRMDITPLPSGGRRFYVSLAKTQVDSIALVPTVRVSDDEGATFTDHAFPQDSDMTLIGVDALHPERIYAAAPDPQGMGTKILLNDTHGEPHAWRELGFVQTLGSVETPPEGGFFVVDLGTRRLLRLNAGSDGLELVDAAEITCFERSPLGGENFSCATFRLLRADDAGLHTEHLVYDMNQLDAFVSCGGDDAAMIRSCLPQLDYGWCGETHFPSAPLCLELRGEDDTDCAADGGVGCADAGTEPTPKNAKASDCALSAQRSSGRPLLASLLLLALARLLRQRGARAKGSAPTAGERR